MPRMAHAARHARPTGCPKHLFSTPVPPENPVILSDKVFSFQFEESCQFSENRNRGMKVCNS
jgi:hypothetical protein